MLLALANWVESETTDYREATFGALRVESILECLQSPVHLLNPSPRVDARSTHAEVALQIEERTGDAYYLLSRLAFVAALQARLGAKRPYLIEERAEGMVVTFWSYRFLLSDGRIGSIEYLVDEAHVH